MSFDLFSADPNPPSGSDHRQAIEAVGTRRVARRRGVFASVAVVVVIAAVLPIALRSHTPGTSVRADQTPDESAVSTTTEEPATTTSSAALGGARVTTATSAPCHNSTLASCGTFRWTSDPTNHPLKISITVEPAHPTAGQTVTFSVVEDDPDSPFNGCFQQVGFGDNGQGDYFQGLNCPHGPRNCAVAYGPWDPPASTPGHQDKTWAHVYNDPGTYTFKVSDRSQTHFDNRTYDQDGPGEQDGQCMEPYGSASTATVTVEVTA